MGVERTARGQTIATQCPSEIRQPGSDWPLCRIGSRLRMMLDMPRTITHFRYDLGQSAGEAIYLVTVDQQEVAGFPWWVILQSASPRVSYLESFGVNCQSVEEGLQKATDMLDRRHPGAPRTEEDLHIGLKADGTLTGAPFEVLAAM